MNEIFDFINKFLSSSDDILMLEGTDVSSELSNKLTQLGFVRIDGDFFIDKEKAKTIFKLK